MVRRKDIADYDDRGLFPKAMSGDFGSLDITDGLEAGSVASNFMSGVGQFLGAPLDTIRGGITSRRERRKLEAELGRKLTPGESRVMRKKLRELDGRSGTALERSVIGSVGSVAGALATPFAPLAGGIAGQWATGKVVDQMSGDTAITGDQDATELGIKIMEMQQQGEKVPPELVFVVLAANLRDKEERPIVRKLKRLTGTSQFSEAVQAGKIAELNKLMKNKKFNEDIIADIRENTVLLIDPNHPDKTVSEQLADMINQGKMKASDLLLRREMQPIIDPSQPSQQPAVPQSQQQRVAMHNPEIAGIAADLNQMGMTLAIAEDGQMAIVPINSSKLTPHGKA